jgi:ABC-2 type transport system ATP-binding protein
MTPHITTQLSATQFAVRTMALIKRYGKHIALNSVDFTVPESSFYVLVGPNGAGKTTLFKLLLELIRPTSGAINVLGFEPPREAPQIRGHVGYVPERSEDLYRWMDVSRALAYHKTYFPAWDADYAAELTKKLSLRQGKLEKLSKGEVRRVQLVMALAHRPPLLLLDEPSDGLDPLGREILYGILAEHIAANPTTVVVSTHLVFELERLADHLAVLSDGRLIAQMSTDELRQQLKRYVVAAQGDFAPPREATVALNGSERERALTLWGDQTKLSADMQAQGAEIRDVRSLTLQEAAVAFLGMQRV